jgi:hypothetical protein
MTQQLADQLDDVLECWRSSRGDRIGLADISQLIDALNMVTVVELCRTMASKNMSIDVINDELKGIMAQAVKQRAELLAQLSAFIDQPNAPTHRMQ